MRLILGNITLMLLIFVTSGRISVADEVVLTASLEPLADAVIEPLPVQNETPAEPVDPRTFLKDPDNLISPEFKIPEPLEKRTAFWFDIYTKYGSNEHVIHHARYPWIVFKVVDTSDIENGPGHRWTKYHKARKFVQKERRKIADTLRRLSKRKTFKRLKGEERELFEKLSGLKGSRKSVLRFAANSIRTQLGQKDFIEAGLKSSDKYLPFMEAEFQSAGLPVELTRIPFVESSFNEKAESKVGASGIWQIMPRTGKQYLIVNDSIDERNSPLKASLAAIEILRTNYKILKDWPLAVTAYNHGPSGVKRALNKSRSKNIIQLISRYHEGSFKFASSNFFACFLAVLHAEKYHDRIYQIDETPLSPYKPVVLELKKPIRVKTLVKQLKLTKDDVLTYNFDLKDAFKSNSRLPKGYRLLLPAEIHEEMTIAPESGIFREAALELPQRRRI